MVANSTKNKQSEQSRLILTEHNNKKPRNMMLEIQVLALDRHKHMAGLNWLIESKLYHLVNLIIKGHTYKNKQ